MLDAPDDAALLAGLTRAVLDPDGAHEAVSNDALREALVAAGWKATWLGDEGEAWWLLGHPGVRMPDGRRPRGAEAHERRVLAVRALAASTGQHPTLLLGDLVARSAWARR